MLFAQPEMFWLAVAVIPLLGFFLWWSWRRRQRLIRQFVQERLLPGLTVGYDPRVEKRRLLLVVVAAGALLLALARPQWGVVWEEAVSQGRDILITIDTSRSMLAMDTPPTDRLTRAKLAALDLAQLGKSDRFALIAFAGSAFLQCPLTLDEVAFSQSVSALDTTIIPQGGSAVAEAIDTAIKAVEKSGDNHKVLVLITDGEDHDGGIPEVLRRAKKAKLRIFTVGVGTAQGEVIRIPDEQGNMTFLRDENGDVIRSRLNETLLREIATETGGFYLPLSGARPMETLFKRGIEQLPKSDASAKLTRSYREQYYWMVLVAVAALIAEMFWRKDQRKPAVQRRETAVATTVMLALVLFAPAAMASPSAALKDYQSGKYGQSLEEYERLAKEKEDDARLQFNAGAAAFKAGEYEKALRNFGGATTAQELPVQEKAYYNLGNAYYKLGEKSVDGEERELLWEQATNNLHNALQLDAKDEDAKHNLAFIEKRLEQLKKQLDEMEQQQQQQGGDQQNQGKQKKRRNRQKDQLEKQDQAGNKGDKKKDQGPKGEKQGQSEGGDRQDDQSKTPGGKEGQDKQRGQGGDQKDQDGQTGGEKEQEAAAMAMGVMTPKQAQQLLESMKAEEKTIIFQPPQDRAKVPNKTVKDW